MKFRSRIVMTLLATSISAAVAAQTSTPAPAMRAMPKAADPQTAVRTTQYRSVFDSYVAANEDKPISWRDPNALVGSIGGWRVYARESQTAAPASAAPADGGRKPAPHQTH